MAYEMISISALDNDYAISATPPKYRDKESVLALLDTWRHKDGALWPKDVTVATLAAQLKLVYVAHWVIQGYGWVDWRGEEHRKRSKYHHEVIPHSGVATITLEQHIEPNFAPTCGLRALKCGARDETMQRLPLDDTQASKLSVLAINPKNDPEKVVRATLNKSLRKKAQASAMALNAMWSLEITPARVERIQAAQWLYPFYLGQYECGGETLSVQIDAITGAVYVDPPKNVRQARRENIMIVLMGAVAVLVILAVIVSLILKV